MRIDIDRPFGKHQTVVRVVVSDVDYEDMSAHCVNLFQDAKTPAEFLLALAEMAATLGGKAPLVVDGTWQDASWRDVRVDMARIGDASRTVKGLLTEGKKLITTADIMDDAWK